MKKLVVADAARQDLGDIARYTERNWGVARRRLYVAALQKRFLLILEQPAIGASRDEIGSGYRSSPCGQHVVFYRPTEDAIQIIRILHGSMDFHRHLDPQEDT